MSTLRSYVLTGLILFATSAISQQPELILPAANSNKIEALAISPNEKMLASADLDGKIKIWEAESGKLLKTLTRGSIYHLAFTPDNKSLVIASFDPPEVYTIGTGKSVILDHEKYCEGLAISPDGKWIAIGAGTIIKIWDAKNLVLKDTLDATGGSELLFSPDSKTLAIYGNGVIELWSIEKRKVTGLLKGHNSRVISLDFSPDNLQLLSAGDDSTAKLWDVHTGQARLTLVGHNNSVWEARFHPDKRSIITVSLDHTGKIWDRTNGKLLKTIYDHKNWIYRARVSPDNKTYALSDMNGICTIWDAATNTKLKEFQPGKETLYFLEYLKNGKEIITGNYDPILSRWNITTGKRELVYGSHNERLTDIKLSNDERSLLVTSRDGTLRKLDATTGSILFYKPVFNNEWATSAAFSPDDNFIVVAGGRNPSVIYNAAGGLEGTLSDHSSSYESFSKFSPDGKYVLHDDNFSVQLVRLSDNRRLVTIDSISMFTDHKFSQDGAFIITGGENKVRVWSVTTQRMITEVPIATRFPQHIEISPGSKYFLCFNNEQESVEVWETQTGKLVKRVTGYNHATFSQVDETILLVSMDGKVTKMGITGNKETTMVELKEFRRNVEYYFVPGGKTLITKSASGITVSSLENGKILKRLTGHKLSFGKSGKFLYLINDDLMEVYDMQTWEMAYRHFIINKEDHLVQDNDGRYDGTEAARKILYFVCGTEIIELEQAKDQLWVPDLAQRSMRNDQINAKTISDLNICNLSPEVTNTTTSSLNYSFNITPRRGGLGETVLTVNGIEAKRYRPEQMKKTGNSYFLKVNKQELEKFFVPGKENLVTVKAFTADNGVSSRGLIVKEEKSKAAGSPPNLYGVMVGVSDYKGNELDLKYAAKDAADISAAVSGAARKLLNTDGKEHVFMYNLTTGKDQQQIPEKGSIKKVMEEIGKKATANDILLIFFAGHGIMTGQGDNKQFYFLTADASTLSTTAAVKDVGISTTELIEWMKPQNIKAQKRILIFDACNSGQAINDIAGKGLAVRNDDKAQQIKAIDKLNEKSGLFILSASASDQNAYEMGRYSQGLLTYSLLKAMKQRPDILEDGKYLNVSSWFNAAEKTVSEVSIENGARQEPQIVTNTNFNIGLVDQEVMAKIILPQEKPLFAASNFQNSDESIADDDLELSKLINLKLSDLAARNAESKIVYVTATNSPDAYSLTGRYTVNSNNLTMTVNLKQNKVIKHKFEVKGTKDQLNELAAMVATKAAELVK